MKSVSIALLAGMVGCMHPASATEAAVFREKILYSFCQQQKCADGAQPRAIPLDMNGILYGITINGGAAFGGKVCSIDYGCGTAFALDPATGKETVLYSFCQQQNCPDGEEPVPSLIGVNGALYGATYGGGNTGCVGGCGTVFTLDPNTGAEKVLYDFCSYGCEDGALPLAGLIAAKHLLYGTTENGGSGGWGTAFRLDPVTGKETVLYSFCQQDECTDGQDPDYNMLDANGILYGTTYAGGANNVCNVNYGCGTVFSINAKSGAESVLHSFGGGGDGKLPGAGLLAFNGMLYGTTEQGGGTGCGGTGCGTVFSVDPHTGAESVLYSFCSQPNCADGAKPEAGLIEVSGTLYGTASIGGGAGCGSNGCGTVYSIDPGTGTEKVLHSFSGGLDGANPTAGLLGVNGVFYGTTAYGGSTGCNGFGCGTFFELKRKR